MLARSASEALATTSAAVGPSWPIRMSSGPPSRNEKPRSAWSSCIEETPTSITTPSTAAAPSAAQTSARLEKRSSTRVSRPSDRSTRSNPPVIADRSRSMPMTRVPAIFEDRAAVAAGAEGRVDIDAAVTGSEHLDRLAAENGDMAWRSRAHAPAPSVFQSAKCGRLDANGPIAPQISALRRAFPAKKPLQDANAISRPTRHPLFSATEFAGLPWHFERERGPRPSPIPGSALHHSVTALSVKKRLTIGRGFSALSRPSKSGDAPAHTPAKCVGWNRRPDCAGCKVKE